MLKKIGKVFLALFLILLVWIGINFKHVSAFPGIISAFYSKEFCSCYFVVGRDEKTCHDYSRQYVPISEFVLNKDSKQVTVKGLGVTTTTRFIDSRNGCVIE
ncbi:MAG: hypothetical protein SFU98_06955 [Leptospiraceae bacterium]|nr:hypothetical protein [Leptospiraceae bacterium]